ncbi:MAG: hypothetical protein ABW069_05270 [Duganella sp.]
MGALFWLKRYLLAAAPLWAILAAVEWFKGAATRDDYASAALWALAAAGIFTYGHWRRYRLAMPCAACDSIAPARKAGKPSPLNTRAPGR